MAFSQADLNAIAAAQAAHPNLPAGYLGGVAQIETGGSANPDTAASGTGPVGLFQVAPSTYQQPGYGLPPHAVSRDAAITALQDPVTSANFAGDYLSALQTAKGGSLDAATLAFSGGGYGQAQVQASMSQFPGAGSPAATGGGTTMGDTTAAQPYTQGGTAGTGGGQAKKPATGLFASIWELLQRSAVFMFGMFLVLIALVGLMWQSKTVKVNVNALTKAAAA